LTRKLGRVNVTSARRVSLSSRIGSESTESAHLGRPRQRAAPDSYDGDRARSHVSTPVFRIMILGVALCAGAIDCGGHTCNGMACPETSLAVAFSRAIDGTKSYDVNLVADGVPSACTVNMQSSAGCAFTPIWTGSQPAVTLNGVRLQPGGFSGIGLVGKPSSVAVTISENGQIIATVQFDSIRYADVSLDGTDCGTCPAASVTMNIS
jgi:hypothetical protein